MRITLPPAATGPVTRACRKRDEPGTISPEGDALPGEHGRRPLAERPGAQAARGGGEARRLRALQASPGSGCLTRAARGPGAAAAHPVARIRAARAHNRRLPLLLR